MIARSAARNGRARPCQSRARGPGTCAATREPVTSSSFTFIARTALACALLGCASVDVAADGGEDAATVDARLDGSVVDPAWPQDDASILDASMLDAGQLDGSDGFDASPPADTEAPDPGPTATEATYRVLHWNIAGGKENGCATALITRAVRRFVRDHAIDFVGLNEVCPAQHAAIREALRAEWGLGPRRELSAYVGDGTGRVVGNSIHSRFGLEGVTRDRVGEDRYGDRNLLCGRVPSAPHLRFCSTHLTPADATAARQLDRVRARIEGWWTSRRDTVILSGDLNITPNHPALNALYTSAANTPNNPGNRGRYHEVDDDDPRRCPGYGERTVPRATGGPCRQGAKIDFIFVRENRIVDGRYSGDTLDIPSDCTGVCSDHRPVIGRARLRVRH